MKLFEISKQQADWNTKYEKQQIAIVSRDGHIIDKIHNPSEAVQIAAVEAWPYGIIGIEHPTQTVLLVALKDERFIRTQLGYEDFIKTHFANNTLLMKKWLRYGEAMREA